MKNQNRKELSNQELMVKIESSRKKIKEKIDKTMTQLGKEILKMSDIKEKYELNHDNSKLFLNELRKFDNFRKGILKLWIETLRRE